jgi:hypothetical protein
MRVIIYFYQRKSGIMKINSSHFSEIPEEEGHVNYCVHVPVVTAEHRLLSTPGQVYPAPPANKTS